VTSDITSTPRTAQKRIKSSVIAGVIVGAVVLLMSLVALAAWARRRRRRSQRGAMAGISPSEVEAALHVHAEKNAQHDVLTRNEKGEMVLGFHSPEVEDLARGQQQRALASFTPTQTSAEGRRPSGFEREGPPSQPTSDGDGDAESRVAALQGEVHRLRAELLERDEREDSERPPAYN
jgi:hypothetical protein